MVDEKYGPKTIRLAAEGFAKDWSMQRQFKSPNYTTQWHELPKAKFTKTFNSNVN